MYSKYLIFILMLIILLHFVLLNPVNSMLLMLFDGLLLTIFTKNQCFIILKLYLNLYYHYFFVLISHCFIFGFVFHYYYFSHFRSEIPNYFLIVLIHFIFECFDYHLKSINAFWNEAFWLIHVFFFHFYHYFYCLKPCFKLEYPYLNHLQFHL